MAAAVDQFVGRDTRQAYTTAVAVTPSDSADLTYVSRALCIGTAGALKVTMADGTACTFAGIPVGVWPIRASRVWSTGTTAANITALT